MRRTALSPCTVGSVATRSSSSRPLKRTLALPSCGSRRSEMFRLERILMRDTTGLMMLSGTVSTRTQVPSMRMRTTPGRPVFEGSI